MYVRFINFYPNCYQMSSNLKKITDFLSNKKGKELTQGLQQGCLAWVLSVTAMSLASESSRKPLHFLAKRIYNLANKRDFTCNGFPCSWGNNFVFNHIHVFAKLFPDLKIHLLMHSSGSSIVWRRWTKKLKASNIMFELFDYEVILPAAVITDKLNQGLGVIAYVDIGVLLNQPPFLPHFILVIEKKDNSYFYYDPWDGKIHQIGESLLNEAIQGIYARFGLPVLLMTLNQ